MSVVREPGRAVLNMAAKGASFAVEKGAQLVLVLVAAPVLGVAAFGRFSFAASLGALLAFATDLGLTTWTTRALARDAAQTPAVLGTGLRLRLLAAVPVLAALAGVAMAVSAPDLRWAVLALGAAALARAFLDHARAVFRAHERLGDEGKVNAATAVAGTLCGSRRWPPAAAVCARWPSVSWPARSRAPATASPCWAGNTVAGPAPPTARSRGAC